MKSLLKAYRVLLALGAPKAFAFAGLGLGYYHLNKKKTCFFLSFSGNRIK